MINNAMNAEQQEAYEWAMIQNFQSVAARYAKTLAEAVESLQAQLAESQRRADAAVEDIMCSDHCDVCVYKDSGTSCALVDFDCADCDDPVCVCRCCRDEDKWQWRGPSEAG